MQKNPHFKRVLCFLYFLFVVFSKQRRVSRIVVSFGDYQRQKRQEPGCRNSTLDTFPWQGCRALPWVLFFFNSCIKTSNKTMKSVLVFIFLFDSFIFFIGLGIFISSAFLWSIILQECFVCNRGIIWQSHILPNISFVVPTWIVQVLSCQMLFSKLHFALFIAAVINWAG